MILEWIRFGLCAVCLITAMICFTAAVLGANRFGFIMNRLHAAGIGDTLGLFLVAVSIIIGDGFHMQELKMLMILVFMTFTSPVSSHFLTQLEYFTNPHLYSYVKREGLDEPGGTPGRLDSPGSGQDAVSGGALQPVRTSEGPGEKMNAGKRGYDMTLSFVIRAMLLLLLIICAVAVNINQNLLQAVIIFMSYSSIMCIVWITLESPDLAITEAAVGAGISGTLFLLTLKKISAVDAGEIHDEKTGMFHTGDTPAGPMKENREMLDHDTE